MRPASARMREVKSVGTRAASARSSSRHLRMRSTSSSQRDRASPQSRQPWTCSSTQPTCSGAPRAPEREVADYIWDWDDKMPGGFYVMISESVGWP